MRTRKKKKPIDFKYNLKQYWSIIRNYKPWILVLLVSSLLIEATMLVDKFILKEVIDKAAEFSAGTLSRPEFVSLLLIFLLVFVGLLITRPIIKWVNFHVLVSFTNHAMYELKKRMLTHLLKLSHNFHSTHKIGSIISRLVRGGWALDGLNDVFVFNFIPLLLQTILVVGSILLFDTLSAIVVFLVILAFTTFSIIINKIQQKAHMEANNQEDHEKGVISDIFMNIDSIKFFGKETQMNKKYQKIARKTQEKFVFHWNYFRWLAAGHTLILTLGTLLVLFFPIMKLLKGTMTIGEVVFIFTVYGNIVGPLFSFDHGIRSLYKAMADFESLFYYYKIENEIKDKPNAKDMKIKRGTIDFKNVSFKYKKKYVLNNFTLSIPENKKVAFVGPSGAGKSTIVKVLYRLYDIEKGSVEIDGVNITDLKQESLRSELSVVPQECILFDDTMYNNIAFSKPNAKRAEVMNAIKFAQLDKVISGFPDKERTIVGERGVKLSGGEKQRVSIARAILANKRILVLDEATSALDSETEHEIQKDLHELMKGRTTLIIAHRLSTIMTADVIVVLDKGKIIQMGKHSDLIRKEGMYKKLWNLQKGGYIK